MSEFSNKLKVPITLLSKKFLGDSIDLSTWLSAAKWKTISGSDSLKIFLKKSLSFKS